MSTITDGAIMSALGRQLTKAVAQQAAAAGNLANIDTPGYRAREASFGDVLDGEIGKLSLTTTTPGLVSVSRAENRRPVTRRMPIA